VELTGNPSVLREPMIAIVGTRRATPRGLAFARALARSLAVQGWVIASGLARGIDAAAHQGALEVEGRTVGVMATGVDRTYPAEHRRLRKSMEVEGCCITEFPVRTGPRKYHFPRRNRLIAGLSQGVVVIEAPAKSGALWTAQLALDYNREVFAVPGPIDLETSRGCHQLLREGAHLLESVADIEAVLNLPSTRAESTATTSVERPLPPTGSVPRWILDRLDFDGIPQEEIYRRWAGNDAALARGILTLEMAGLIQRLPQGRLARKIW
jgi:DNA processing protein